MSSGDGPSDEGVEFDRLLRFLTRPGPRFGLGLAIVRDAVVGRELRGQLAGASGRRVAELVLEYDDADADLVERMLVAGEGAEVLFVVGFERLLVDAAGRPRATPAIANLNQRRDSLPELLDLRVVVWLAREAYASFCEQAWDLRQVMLTVAEFGRSATLVVPQAVGGESPQWLSFVPESEVPALRSRAEALARLAETASDLRSSADAAASAASAFVSGADFERAAVWLERAAAKYEQLGDGDEWLLATMKLADLRYLRGEVEEARRLLRDDALAYCERAGFDRLRAIVMSRIADWVMVEGEPDEALRILREQVLPVFEQQGEPSLVAATLGKIADAWQAAGELDEALRVRREQQLPLVDSLGDELARAEALGQLARVLMALGRTDEALRVLREQQLPIVEEHGDELQRAATYGAIADVLRARGEVDEAIRIRRAEQLPVVERSGAPLELVKAYTELASDLVARRRSDDQPEIARLVIQVGTELQRLHMWESPFAAQALREVRALFAEPSPS